MRAAAKNFNDVVIIASKNDYEPLLEILIAQNGITSLEQRKDFAGKAFEITSHYDTAIRNWFGENENFTVNFSPETPMRYGENPHQQAAFYGQLDAVFEKLHGKDISFNNLVDIESAVFLMEEFAVEKENGLSTFAVIKHTNACGLATDASLENAWKKALSADPVSAFGGVLICNSKLDTSTAVHINELFFEVMIAPEYEAGALDILKTKKNRIILKQKLFSFPSRQFKSLLNGALVQDRNIKTTSNNDLRFVTTKRPSNEEVEDLLFAEKAVKHLKSNGITLVKNKQLIGCGTGQTSRIDALNQAIAKAEKFGFFVAGAVMASEAFFPFPDCVEIAHKAGITAVIQPGGSVRDQESIDYCNAHGLSMVLSGVRHFKH
ncbi:MAG: bifunctional phosphoribosylaminoimidazolecarboxamide formyltransferase/IMP cyclohydrolase [Chitinophagales bacterium]